MTDVFSRVRNNFWTGEPEMVIVRIAEVPEPDEDSGYDLDDAQAIEHARRDSNDRDPMYANRQR